MSVQYRGHCQVCGRQHAVTKGFVAKHGYTVKDGWFEGVCSGANHGPMEHDTTVTAEIVAKIRVDCDELRKTASRYQSGELTPTEVPNLTRNAPAIQWSEANEYQRSYFLKVMTHQMTSRASQGEYIADSLEKLASEVHGKPLVEAKRDEAPAKILCGEKRRCPTGVLTVTSVRGGRVYWIREEIAGRRLEGWTGSQSWRKYPLA